MLSVVHPGGSKRLACTSSSMEVRQGTRQLAFHFRWHGAVFADGWVINTITPKGPETPGEQS